MWYMNLLMFGIGAVAGGLLTTCFTYYFLKKYEVEEQVEEQAPEVIDIKVPVPEPIVNNSPEFDVWDKF